MKHNLKTVTTTLLCLLIISSTISADSDVKQITLEEALSKVMSVHPSVKNSSLEVAKTQLLIKEVRMSRFVPVLKLSGKTGVVPEARGDIFSSQDNQTDLDGLGPFYKLDLKIVQPVLTFGRASAAMSAARKGVEVSVARKRETIEKVSFDTIRAYWALAGARKAVKVAKDLKKNFDKLQKEVEKLLEDEDSEVDDSQLLEVKANKYIIESQHLQSLNGVARAEELLKALTGITSEEALAPVASKLPAFSFKKEKLNTTSEKVVTSHFSMEGLKSAALALNYKQKYFKSDMKPVIYIGGGFSWGHAPNRTDQKNPFAYDPFNYTSVGAFLGMEWDLNPVKKKIAWRKTGKEREILQNKSTLLKEKIRLEFRSSLQKTDERYRLLKSLRKSLKAAKSWLTLSLDNWEAGIGEVATLIKAYKAYYELKGLEIKKETELNISIAQLAYKMGDIKKYLKWVKNEKIQID